MENIILFTPIYCNHVYKGGKRKHQVCGRYCRKIREGHKCGQHRARPKIKCPHNPQKGNRC